MKGRVFIANAGLSEHSILKILPEVNIALSNPKSSFYPNYLEQDGKNGQTSKFKTYNTGGLVRGFKRYPVKKNVIDNQGTGDMATIFKPLDKGSQFNCKIRFHNLRPVEIGALLSSLTFHKTDIDLMHSIGMGKSLGYGAIKININGVFNLKYSENEYFKSFEKEMRLKDNSWGNDRFIKELILMSKFQSKDVEDQLAYPKLENFQEYKNKGYYLQSYSEITKTEIGIKNLISNHDMKSAIDIKNADKIKSEKLRFDWEEKLKGLNENQSESSLENLISECPYQDLKVGIYLCSSKFTKSKNILNNDVQIALNTNTFEGYKLFLNKHKESIYNAEIRSNIKSLKATELSLSDLGFNKYYFEDIKNKLKEFLK
ncbi:MAG: hypothetical protein IPL23_15565 [Saprospiraceae bacterium]|nr:hypothetical protein [Saprospiraceae bacterium]